MEPWFLYFERPEIQLLNPSNERGQSACVQHYIKGLGSNQGQDRRTAAADHEGHVGMGWHLAHSADVRFSETLSALWIKKICFQKPLVNNKCVNLRLPTE